MVQLPRPQDPAAIFSPSVARIAASTARDWSYVDAWLASKFPGRPVPNFERNPETLKALLALATHSEAADEERHLLARAASSALQELTSSDPVPQANDDRPLPLRDGLLSTLEHTLPQEGDSALEAMALMAVQAGIALPEPRQLARSIIGLQANIYETDQMHARTNILKHHIEEQAQKLEHSVRNLQTESWKAPPDMAKQNLEMQRKVKAMSTQLPDLRDRVAALAASLDSSQPTVHGLVKDEAEYLAILERKEDLDQQLGVFEGLSSDPEMARSELEALRRRLRGFTSHRDAVFEGLVERESPVKRR
jgi:HAUS augmin-like complex subunit 1